MKAAGSIEALKQKIIELETKLADTQELLGGSQVAERLRLCKPCIAAGVEQHERGHEVMPETLEVGRRNVASHEFGVAAEQISHMTQPQLNKLQREGTRRRQRRKPAGDGPTAEPPAKVAACASSCQHLLVSVVQHYIVVKEPVIVWLAGAPRVPVWDGGLPPPQLEPGFAQPAVAEAATVAAAADTAEAAATADAETAEAVTAEAATDGAAATATADAETAKAATASAAEAAAKPAVAEAAKADAAAAPAEAAAPADAETAAAATEAAAEHAKADAATATGERAKESHAAAEDEATRPGRKKLGTRARKRAAAQPPPEVLAAPEERAQHGEAPAGLPPSWDVRSPEDLQKCMLALVPEFGYQPDPSGRSSKPRLVGLTPEILHEATQLPVGCIKDMLKKLVNRGDAYDTLTNHWMPMD